MQQPVKNCERDGERADRISSSSPESRPSESDQAGFLLLQPFYLSCGSPRWRPLAGEVCKSRSINGPVGKLWELCFSPNLGWHIKWPRGSLYWQTLLGMHAHMLKCVRAHATQQADWAFWRLWRQLVFACSQLFCLLFTFKRWVSVCFPLRERVQGVKGKKIKLRLFF